MVPSLIGDPLYMQGSNSRLHHCVLQAAVVVTLPALHVCRRLRDPNGKAPGLLGWWPSKAVTFVDNHDTGARWIAPAAWDGDSVHAESSWQRVTDASRGVLAVAHRQHAGPLAVPARPGGNRLRLHPDAPGRAVHLVSDARLCFASCAYQHGCLSLCRCRPQLGELL